MKHALILGNLEINMIISFIMKIFIVTYSVFHYDK